MNLPIENPVKVAVIFDQEVETGGGFQQGINSALLALKIDSKLAKIFFFHTKKKLKKDLLDHGINSQLIKISFFEKLYLYIKTTKKYRIIFEIIKVIFDYHFFESFLIKKDIELVYFISPSRYSLDLNKLNFIFTIWDLCHRDHIEFPEIKLHGEFEDRELRIKYALKRAISIIVDSKFSKINLQDKYNVEKSRISIIPFEPSKEIKEIDLNKSQKLNLDIKYITKNKYIFYPAQFWPHKNHIYILKSIFILEKKYNIFLDVIFAGGDKGCKKNIISFAKSLGINDRIIFRGFVSNQELISLYKSSLALVMPTFFGPTNIPPLEAFKLGIPVIYPDLKGLRDQVQDAALLVNLYDPDSLANCLINLMKNDSLRNKLIKKGFVRYKEIENYERSKILNEVLTKFILKYNNFRKGI